ncbi:HEAT repeat domain-containing protein [Nocardia sp. NPDC050710]|uniref:HEAT repeat domain-containing protein n=1 Tax=Nocardia sp. NPDC050710 TaxID=3157220 RepID=UPI0033E76CF0
MRADTSRRRIAFKRQLVRLYEAAGRPSLRLLERHGAGHGVSDATLSDWLNGRSMPRGWDDSLEWVIETLLRRVPSGSDDIPRSLAQWRRDYHAAIRRHPSDRGDDQLREELLNWCAREESRLVGALARLPYLPPRRDPIELDVGAVTRLHVRHRTQRPDDVYLAPAARRGAAGSTPIGFAELIAGHRRIVLLGDPGMGKTWLLGTTAVRMLRAARTHLTSGDIDEVRLPLLVRCDALAAEPGIRDMESATVAALGRRVSLSPRFGAWLSEYCRSNQHAVFLLDALDETPEERRHTVTALVDNLVNPEAKVVVTCRISGYHTGILPSADRIEAELLPLDDPTAYIASWNLPQDRRAQLADRLRNPAVDKMARIPLLLAFLCHLCADPDEPLPQTRVELYGRILRRFLREEHRADEPPAARCLSWDPITREQELLALLRPLALAIATDPGGWQDRIPAETLERVLADLDRPRNLGVAETLRVLTVETGILVPDGDIQHGRTPPYLFLHRTFAEYLVAEQLSRHPRLIELCAAEHLHLAPEWHETWLLTASLAPETTLGLLSGMRSDPLHIALATGAAAVAELTAAQRAQHRRCVERLRDTAIALAGSPSRPAQVRRLAVDALGRIGDPIAMDVLMRALSTADKPEVTDADVEVTVRAGTALARIGGPAVVAALAVAATDPDKWVRWEACATLRKLGGPEVAEPLRSALGDPDRDVRLQAIEGLDDIGDVGRDEVLLAAMSESDWEIRSVVTQRAIERELVPATVSALRGIVTGHFGAGSRFAAERLGVIGGVGELRNLLAHPDRDTRLCTVRALESFEGPMVATMVRGATVDPDPTVREAAVEVLGSVAGLDAVETLWTMAYADPDIDSDVRVAAWHRLTILACSEVLALIRDRVANRDVSEEPAAPDWAGQRRAGDTAGVSAVLGTVLTDRDSRVRVSACRLLGIVGGPIAVAVLKWALSDRSAWVVEYAAEALAGIGGDDVIAALRDLLGHPERRIRVMACRMLGKAGDHETAVEALSAMATDDDVDPYDVAYVAQGLGTEAVAEVIRRWLDYGGTDFLDVAVELAYPYFTELSVRGDGRAGLLELLDRLTRLVDSPSRDAETAATH